MKMDLCTNPMVRKKPKTFQQFEGMSLFHHINAFTNIPCLVEDIGIKLENYKKVMILLCMLTSHYEAAPDNLLTGKCEKTRKYDEIVIAIQVNATMDPKTQFSIRGQSLLTERGRL